MKKIYVNKKTEEEFESLRGAHLIKHNHNRVGRERVSCLKCGREFKSPDKCRIRICTRCTRLNEFVGYRQEYARAPS